MLGSSQLEGAEPKAPANNSGAISSSTSSNKITLRSSIRRSNNNLYKDLDDLPEDMVCNPVFLDYFIVSIDDIYICAMECALL